MEKKDSFRLSRLGRHWVLSLLAGFVVMLILLLMVTLGAVRMMKTDKIAEHGETIITIQRSMDRYMLTLEQLVVELMLNNQSLALQKADDKAAFVTAATYGFCELISNIKTANACVEDIYLYYPAQDYVVGTKGSYTPRGYYLLSNELTDIGYADWREDILLGGQTGFFFYPDRTGELKLYLCQPLSLDKGRTQNAVALLCVNGDEFAHLLTAMCPADKSTVAAVFTNDGRLYRSGQTPVPDSLQAMAAQGKGAGQMADGSSIGWREPSGYDSFTYVVASDLSVLLASITRVQRLLLEGLVLCVTVGVGFSLFLSWRHHAPIEKTLRRLDSAHGGKQMDYYEFEQRVNDLIRENENTARLNEKMIWTLKKTVLSDILTQRLSDAATIENLLEATGITLDYVYNRLLLVDVSFEEDETRVQHWLFRAGDVFEREHTSAQVIPTVAGGAAVFLVNYETAGQGRLQRLYEIFLAECGCETVCSQSEEFMTTGQLAPLFEQTLTRLRRPDGSSAPDAEQAGTRFAEGTLLFERWQEMLRRREYAGAVELVDEVFQAYVAMPDPYVRMCRRYAVVCAVLQCAGSESVRLRCDELATASLRELKACTDSRHLPGCVQSVLQDLERRNSQDAARHQDNLAFRIKKIIETSYNQPYLGLYYISDQVKVSTSYVSKVFKEGYGFGVVEYMNRLRIDGAKKLLETQQLTIKEIAEKVGFTSDIHFIRIFKKYEHSTPGVYRKQSK